MAVNPYRVYMENEINSAGKGKLVLMLYNGVIRFLAEAKNAINNKDIPEAHNKITRASDIISELRASLDESAGDIAVNLDRLYEYVEWRLLQANIKKDNKEIDAVIPVITDLRDTWAQAIKSPLVNVK